VVWQVQNVIVYEGQVGPASEAEQFVKFMVNLLKKIFSDKILGCLTNVIFPLSLNLAIVMLPCPVSLPLPLHALILLCYIYFY